MLPPFCMRCGAPATIVVTRIFATHIALLAFLMDLAPSLAGRIWPPIWFFRLRAPMCATHQLHWFKLGMFHLCTFFLLGSLFVAGFILPVWIDADYRTAEQLRGNCGLVIILVLFTWLIATLSLETMSITATAITSAGLRLTGIHPAFVHALEESRIAREGPTKSVTASEST
jgi:hypothetical protein